MSGSAHASSGGESVFSMIKLGLVLAAYAVASCTVLAVVNNVTAPVIALNQERKAQEGMKAVFAEASAFETVDGFAPAANAAISVDALFLAKDGPRVLGAVAQVSGPTYDHATILVGLDTAGTVTGVRFLENTDSPGFGLKASDASFLLPGGTTFYGQFAGKRAADGFVAGQTFDAISGATITSAGVGELVSAGTASIAQYLQEHDYE